mmetsp:Transcript_25564/g.80649  ORF Transcript_25564/g.80649 Transcript_25564/m.80649 type:complete len:294 (-) Transcript_25564:42-923(-)
MGEGAGAVQAAAAPGVVPAAQLAVAWRRLGQRRHLEELQEVPLCAVAEAFEDLEPRGSSGRIHSAGLGLEGLGHSTEDFPVVGVQGLQADNGVVCLADVQPIPTEQLAQCGVEVLEDVTVEELRARERTARSHDVRGPPAAGLEPLLQVGSKHHHATEALHLVQGLRADLQVAPVPPRLLLGLLLPLGAALAGVLPRLRVHPGERLPPPPGAACRPRGLGTLLQRIWPWPLLSCGSAVNAPVLVLFAVRLSTPRGGLPLGTGNEQTCTQGAGLCARRAHSATSYSKAREVNGP